MKHSKSKRADTIINRIRRDPVDKHWVISSDHEVPVWQFSFQKALLSLKNLQLALAKAGVPANRASIIMKKAVKK